MTCYPAINLSFKEIYEMNRRKPKASIDQALFDLATGMKAIYYIKI